jgi:hypothetical protein
MIGSSRDGADAEICIRKAEMASADIPGQFLMALVVAARWRAGGRRRRPRWRVRQRPQPQRPWYPDRGPDHRRSPSASPWRSLFFGIYRRRAARLNRSRRQATGSLARAATTAEASPAHPPRPRRRRAQFRTVCCWAVRGSRSAGRAARRSWRGALRRRQEPNGSPGSCCARATPEALQADPLSPAGSATSDSLDERGAAVVAVRRASRQG